MFAKNFTTRRRFSVLLSLFFCAAFTALIFYEESNFLETNWPQKTVNIPGKTPANLPFKNGKVLLPLGFRFPKYTLRNHLKGTSGEHWPRFQLSESEDLDLPPHKTGRFKKSKSVLYGFSRNDDCGSKTNLKLAVDKSKSVPLNLNKTFEIFLEEAETYGDTYNKHLRQLLEKYMEGDKIEKHWFRFSGTSVWLKDYNVHFVVSRLIMTENGERNNPKISLPLAQVFDENWRELDVRLVFPGNSVDGDAGFRLQGQAFYLYRFPRILPIPFTLEQDGDLCGTEDPRMMLVESRNGHEEPIVVFNAFHKEKPQGEEIPFALGYRSIFMSFPFQVQKGKQIQGADTEETKNQWFSLTKQLTIKGEKKNKIEKNWIPFVSGAREFQEHVFLVTLFDPLKVIRCDLWTSNGECSVQEGNADSSVGALRGGTPLISIFRTKDDQHETFVGFARAHLTDCGCGHHFYRPNLVVVARKGKTWSVTHVSSSVELEVRGLPWNPDERICNSVNAIIPNGIEFWDLEKDLMSLDVSVTDLTVERVHVKGVLKALKEARYWEPTSAENSKGPMKCALDKSKEFCMIYGMQHQE